MTKASGGVWTVNAVSLPGGFSLVFGWRDVAPVTVPEQMPNPLARTGADLALQRHSQPAAGHPTLPRRMGLVGWSGSTTVINRVHWGCYALRSRYTV